MTVVTEPEFYTMPELAARLRVSVPTLRRWRSNGEGPKGTKLGGQVRYAHVDVQRWIEARP